MSYNDANEVTDELRSSYQGNLQISVREKDFIFESVQLMYYKCNKVNF